MLHETWEDFPFRPKHFSYWGQKQRFRYFFLANVHTGQWMRWSSISCEERAQFSFGTCQIYIWRGMVHQPLRPPFKSGYINTHASNDYVFTLLQLSFTTRKHLRTRLVLAPRLRGISVNRRAKYRSQRVGRRFLKGMRECVCVLTSRICACVYEF